MILTEYLRDNTLIKHYSDKGVLLLQQETGLKYADPVDVVPCAYTYIETNEPVEKDIDSNEATISDYQDALGEFGVQL